MRERKVKYAVLAGLAVGGIAGVSHADIIYQDSFDGTAGFVGGRTPDQATGVAGGTAAAMWTADTTTVPTISSTASDADWQSSGGTYSTTGSTNASIGLFG